MNNASVLSFFLSGVPAPTHTHKRAHTQHVTPPDVNNGYMCIYDYKAGRPTLLIKNAESHYAALYFLPSQWHQ